MTNDVIVEVIQIITKQDNPICGGTIAFKRMKDNGEIFVEFKRRPYFRPVFTLVMRADQFEEVTRILSQDVHNFIGEKWDTYEIMIPK